uniref:PROP1-like PPR domain-containing protein n=1 Tax=Physcomitrium patens TaxID=3218 RepID=A0A7I4DQ64_PHYPA
MGPLRLTLQHVLACPCVPCYRWGSVMRLCLRRFAHVVAETSYMDSPSSYSWRDLDYEVPSPVDYSGLAHRPYWVTREKLQARDDEKEKLVAQVLNPRDEFSVKDMLSCWVRKIGSRHHRLMQENTDGNSLSGARYVRYEQVARTVNAVLQELGRKGYPDEALQVLEWMQLQGWCRLDPHLYTTIIDTLGSSGCLDLAKKIFSDMDDSVKKDTVLYNSLLHAYCKSGQVETANELFNSMKQKDCRPDLSTYNTIMNMYVKTDVGLTKVLSLFKEMCLQGIQPDVVSYDILLAACAPKQHVKEAQRIFDTMKKRRGIKPTVVTYTSLITVYANAGDFRSAMQVFGEMVAEKCQPNVKTFTSLINSCRKGGHVEEAQTIFEAMKEYGVKPNVVTYNALINVYTERGEQDGAQRVFLQMVQSGLQPTGVSFTVLMSSFKATGAFKEVLSIYDQAKQLKTVCSVQTFTEALDACSKAKNIPAMIKVLDDMRAAACPPSAVTCTVLLVALSSKCSNDVEVFDLLHSLEVFDSELAQCCHLLLTNSSKTDTEVFNLLGRCFNHIPQEDEKTWTALGSSLLDALWALGRYRRAALVLGWLCDNSNIHDDLCTVTRNEWKLDVRRLSSGGAIVALYQWLAHLFLIAQQFEAKESIHDGSEGMNVIEETKAFPRFVTIITGWGKLSKEEGRSQVRAGIEREIIKLGVPFRTSNDAGRWTANGEALLRWLLRPETPSRLTLWDMSARLSR